jgi:ketosteroid isomerase-like protein
MVSEKSEEIAIRRVIEDWASAVRARDINGVIAHHTDDVLMYDVPPPTTVRGISAYRETWPPFFKALAEGGAHSTSSNCKLRPATRLGSRRHYCDVVRRKCWPKTLRGGCA